MPRPNTALHISNDPAALSTGPSAELVNEVTVIDGPGPLWQVGEFTVVAGQALKLTAYNLLTGDKVCIRQVYKRQEGVPVHRDEGCCNTDPGVMVTVASVPYMYSGQPICLTSAQPIYRICDAGIYILEVSGVAFANRAAIVTAEKISTACVANDMFASRLFAELQQIRP